MGSRHVISIRIGILRNRIEMWFYVYFLAAYRIFDLQYTRRRAGNSSGHIYGGTQLF